jgi:serine protease Do
MTSLLAALVLSQSKDLIVDDAAMLSALVTYGEQVANGKVPSNNATLQTQLSRVSAKVKLPEAKPLVRKESDIYNATRKATVIFTSFGKCPDCGKFHPNPASGFIISPDGLAITNYHVIKNSTASAFAAMTVDKKIYAVTEVLAANEKADVALVRIEGKDLPYLPVRAYANPGETVYCLSHPRSKFFTMTKGAASRYMMERGTPWLEITADYAVGSSGGPVFDATGQVIGLVSMTNSVYSGENRTSDLQMVRKICVPSQAILNLIQK